MKKIKYGEEPRNNISVPLSEAGFWDVYPKTSIKAFGRRFLVEGWVLAKTWKEAVELASVKYRVQNVTVTRPDFKHAETLPLPKTR